MMSHVARINIYLLTLAMVLLTACESTGSKTSKPLDKSAAAKAKRDKKDATLLLVHLEADANFPDRTLDVVIYRSRPIKVKLDKAAFLHSGHVQQAAMVDTPEGHALTIQLNREGTILLENISTLYRGKRIAIAVQFGEQRWIGAPILSRRITDGLLMFQPDATREETERIARGLNNVIREANK